MASAGQDILTTKSHRYNAYGSSMIAGQPESVQTPPPTNTKIDHDMHLFISDPEKGFSNNMKNTLKGVVNTQKVSSRDLRKDEKRERPHNYLY